MSLSFDKLLEASLYAKELQGGAKPPESLANLLRAASVLRRTPTVPCHLAGSWALGLLGSSAAGHSAAPVLGQSFGAVHLHFGAPISLRRLIADPTQCAPFECDRLAGAASASADILGIDLVPSRAPLAVGALLCGGQRGAQCNVPPSEFPEPPPQTAAPAERGAFLARLLSASAWLLTHYNQQV